jgi:hypothetical protein
MSALPQHVDASERLIPVPPLSVVSATNLIKRYGDGAPSSMRCAASRSRSSRAA